MNTHLRFSYLFVVLFGLLVVSCHSTPDTVVLSLSQAERIMESDPDSAMTILKHIPTPESLHGKAQADYSLLMTQAMDKNYMKFTSDSLIKFAVGYYGSYTEDIVSKGKAFYYYGRVMESLDKVEDAMKFYLKAKDVLGNSHEYKLLGLMSEGIGNLNRKQKLFDAALNDFRASLQFYSQIPDSLGISFAYRNIGRVFLYKEQLDSAYHYFDKALHIADIKKYPSASSILLEVGVIHRSANDYLGAENCFLSFIEREINKDNLYSGYLALGNLYLYMNRLKEAKMYLALCLKSPNIIVKRDACECLYDLEKELNNFGVAIGYKDIADSLQSITQDIDIRNTIADLRSKYDSEKWQKESLQASIEKKNILLTGSFVGFIAILVIIYIYYKYRINQKLIRDISQRIRQNATEIEMYQEQILNYRNLQKETLKDYRNQIGELQGKVSVLEDQNKTLSIHLVEKKGNIPDSDDNDLYAIYMQGLRILLMLRKKEDMDNNPDKKQLLDGDWDKLFHLSNALHNDFIMRIKKEFPNLTKHDLEICCLLRFGITHDVLGLAFLTTSESVTKAKGRLKKRLNLSTSDDLDDFLRKY
ncbi:tetratricopeptide repeat protein [Bacteroides fragilis]|uniref:tetratricopeptide repeat protein n=1 Tax=Bacteroides TaxID=816 RepID=UPI0013EA4ACC|nr:MULTISPECIES: tetratricopeptide repeat protein [Bacteroides]MCE8621704.1 tetratricopeptide repeat protein [Bacteroides fragilis]MCE8625447.1 tetratricopeptide repeat protein [Bacteroides fragilis]MCE8699035.1 tetratricopeptide repeat protein [Bacteroides fragilis]MCE8703993.1 tetratricopeptide repeat protein [Bacteroides fragilis]MCE9325438.1 tetratricopeptide repeat protein [Bacteroides fragilis]